MSKPRRIVITLEVETDVSLKDMKEGLKEEIGCWLEQAYSGTFDIHQVQVNVVKGTAKRKGKK